MVCAGDSVSVGPTSMTPAWTSRDLAATEYPHTESDGQASDNTTGSSSTASYTSFVTSETVTKSWRDSTVANNVTEPSQVSDLRVSFVGVTQVTLTWKNGNDTVTCRMLLEAIESHNTLPQVSAVSISHLTPGIQHKITLCLSESNEEDRERGVEANTTESFSQQPRNRMAPVSGCQLKHAILSSDRLLTRDTEVLIMGLGPDTQYNASVYSQAADGTEGQPQLITFRTLASQVLDLRVVSINATSMNLTWKINDNESPSVYTYKIQVTGETDSFTLNVSETQVIITSLNSSTLYNITVHPFFGNSSEGVPGFLQVYTPPHPVSDFRVTSVRTREIGLAWSSNDADFFKILTTEDGAGKPLLEAATPNQSIVIGGLYPGTKYRFEIFPQGPNGTEGESQMVYGRTDPSAVFDIQVLNVTTTGMELEWENTDNGSEYTYHLVIQSERGSEQKTSSDKKIILEDLVPGTLYNITIFPEVNHIQGTPGSIAQYTWPSDVANIDVNTSTTTAALIWQNFDEASPRYTYHLFIEKDGNISKVLVTDIGVTSATVTELIPGSSYTVEIFTQVGDVTTPMASGRQSFCTDPPSPDGSPNITSISHNSVKVEFSGFEASHGPIKAYALILTTGDAIRPSADVLRYTYEDFKKGASNTYVTYLITTEEKRRSQDSSEVLKYEIDVGNESTTHGYYNGKLEPLGSYRACVAGFTNITFKPHSNGLIDGPESYVSFSHYSDAVSLPQDPGVICGAVFGCIFGALVIVAVGGFIFWRKKRKEAKNNELSFSQIKSKLIRVENFEAYFKKQQADSNCGFAEEYEDLKLVGISLPKYTAELAENRGKNRYNNVLPYDISRVKLSVQSHSTDDYINANYMPGYHSKKDFIATQGPLPNTLKDFWRMVWEKNVYAIVMLTKCVEQGRTKCEEYWPSKQAQDYGDITVAMTSEIVLPQWTIRDFTVKNLQTSESHPLRQFHFTSWPDHGVPDTTDLLINFRYLVRDYMKQSPPGSPILVHCSAGVGRTGTFIAIDRLIYQIENENTVDVYGIVYDLRMHRPLMVQTEDQYVFLNQCVLDIIRSQKDSKVDLIYQNTTAMTIYENLAPVTAFGRTNGYIA
uniref:Receptor-type tyrosine-protein phosphatase eta n=1 Tax=Suricata suricatta TaxID=37032 RepID=A0A673UBQ0_SURSU